MNTMLAFAGASVGVMLAVSCTSSNPNQGGDEDAAADALGTRDAAPDAGAMGQGMACILGAPKCPVGQTCCSSTGTPNPVGSCTVPSDCNGTFQVACASAQGCAAGESCCASTTARAASEDAGAIAPGFANMTIVVSCQSSCTEGEFQLCVQDKECPPGRTCQFGRLASYCLPPLDAGAEASTPDAGSAQDAADGKSPSDGAVGG